VSGFKYYLVILDDHSHYLWTFPLRLKSDTYTTLTHFFAHVQTKFGVTVKAVQYDYDKEFDNSSARTFFLTHGVHLRMSCPYTSTQNGKAERIIRSTNNVVRSLLFQASAHPSFWVEALSIATHLLNLLPTKTLDCATPHSVLFGTTLTYDHLRVFGCKCYPNLSATTPHKLAPRSALCVFLGYSAHHKGYRCLDLATNKVIISRHVVFDEASFPFAEQHPQPVSPAALEFLDSTDFVPAPVGPSQHPVLASTPPRCTGSSLLLAERSTALISDGAPAIMGTPGLPGAQPRTASASAQPRTPHSPKAQCWRIGLMYINLSLGTEYIGVHDLEGKKPLLQIW